MSVGESYFPELENMTPVNNNKWGIYNVCLARCDNVVTGYQWKYTYYNDGKRRILSSYDLTKLREKVLSKGLEWIITCNKYAIDSYKLNNELKAKHDKLKRIYQNRENYSSGVKYVYKSRDKRSRKGYYWVYINRSGKGQKSYTNKYLKDLKERILEDGLEWDIVNPKVYESMLSEEEKLLTKEGIT